MRPGVILPGMIRRLSARVAPPLRLPSDARRSSPATSRTIAVMASLAALACFAQEPGSSETPGGPVWQSLWNGTDLTGWQPISFGGEGEVNCRDGVLVLPRGEPFTGIRFTNAFPTLEYELSLEARRVRGSDFFCGLTVPVGTNHCSLIVGGWGGGLVGLSSLDGMDASENETMSIRAFERGRWYRIRLRIVEGRIEAWIDDERVVNVSTAGRTIGLRRGAIEDCRPLGVCSYVTDAEIRRIQWRRLDPAEASQSSARTR